MKKERQKSKEKISKKLSRGEICVANFIPPCESGNHASLGSFFISIFEFMRVEAIKFRKTILAACARQKKYC